MAIQKLFNLARVTTTTVGTGTMNLGSAVPGFLTFADSGVQNGDVVSYGIRDGTGSEVGRGTYNSSGSTLSRDTIIKSTNTNAAIPLTGAGAEVFITPLAEDFDVAGNLAAGFWTSSDIASAATCNIGTATTPYVRITGTTTITSLGSDASKLRFVEFTGALTLTYNGTSLILPGAGNIITRAGDKGIFVSDASGNWKCVAWTPIGSLPKQSLTANRTYYVRTDGSDSNNGLANTSGGALLTIQKAVDVATTLDLNGFNLTIQIADGTYSAGAILKNVTGFSKAGSLVIRGNNSTPGNVLISVTSDCFSADGTNVIWDVLDLKMQTTTSGTCLSAQSGGSLRYGNVNFGACASSHISVFFNGRIQAIDNYAISGGAAIAHIASSYSAIVRATGMTITLSGTPAFGISFAYAEIGGTIALDAMTFSGSATGSRYAVMTGSMILTNSGNTNYLPGNSAGSGTNFATSPYGLYT